MLPRVKRRRLLDPDHVVFQAEVSIDVLFVLKMPRDDPRTVRKRQHAPIRRELMRQLAEQPPPQILEMLHVRLADLAQQQTFQPRHALAIIRTPICASSQCDLPPPRAPP